MSGKFPTSADVRRAIQAGEYPPVWVWAGPEDYLKHELFELLVEKALDPASAAFNVDRFRGEEKPPADDEEDEAAGAEPKSREERVVSRQRTIDRVVTAARTFPMLAGRRVVLLAAAENLDRWSRDVLVDYANAPAPECTLVVLLGTKETWSQRIVGDSFLQRLARTRAQAAVFWVPFEQDTKRWIEREFRKLGKACSPRVAESLYAACSGGEEKVPLGDIAVEIEKIAAGMDADEPEVTEAHLAVVARKAHEAYLARVLDAAADRDLVRALRALDGALLFKENAPVRIVASLSFKVDRIQGGEAARTRALTALAEADRRLKSTSRDPRQVLEMALAAICGTATAGRRP